MAVPLNTAVKLPFLTLVQNACDEIGIAPPASIIGSTDDQTRKLLALSNREVYEYGRMANGIGGWQELYEEYSFETSAFTSTGITTNGSATITGITTTAALTAVKWGVSGTGIPNYASIVSVDSATQITIDRPCTASGSTSLQFGQIAYPMPLDFDCFITQTFWDGSYRWQLLGPLDAQEKNILKYGISPAGPRRRFWIRGNYLFLNPMPTDSTSVIAFDYFGNGYTQSASGISQAKWLADTDYYTLSDDCFVLGLKWRFLRSSGLDYGEEKGLYDEACARQMSRNSSNRSLPLNNTASGLNLLSDANIPDSGYGT